MRKNIRLLTQGALLAALYAALCHLQNLLLPGSGSGMLQLRVAEALCVLAFFTPAAPWGLAVGCLIFNISSGGSLPLDFLVGSAASWLSAVAMYGLRRVRLGTWPLPGLLMPAVLNGLLVGWELSWHMGGLFWLNAAWVAAGEAAVLLSLGSGLYYTIQSRHLQEKLFS